MTKERLSMNPKEYELFTKQDLESRLKSSFKKNITVKHLEKFTSPDGIKHTVDLSYEFTLDGVTYLNIVECKLWNKKVTREMIKSFKSVRDDLRAHKAIMVTNQGYQSGAIEFAKKHGIATIKLTKQVREVFSHFDGGFATTEQALVSESKDVQIGDELELVGFFYPSADKVAKYLIKKFGKEFALFLLHENNLEFDWDNTTSPLPDYLIQAESIDDYWDKEYYLVETGGLNFGTGDELLFREINIKIHLLKMHIEMRKNNA